MRIGVLGGTGPAGRALCARLASVGLEVVIGSRSKDNAGKVRDALVEKWPGRDLLVEGADNETAADAELVVVATPWDAATPTVEALSASLEGKVVISMANALMRIGSEFQALFPPRGSVAAAVQAALPASQVVAACHHLAAKELGQLDHALEADVLLASDHPAALETVAEVLRLVPGVRPLDAGSLVAAGPIESMTAVLLQLNVRYKTRASIKITGIDV